MVDLTHSPPHWGRYLRTAMVGSIGSERPLSAPYSAPGARDAPAIGPAEAHAEDEQWGARDDTPVRMVPTVMPQASEPNSDHAKSTSNVSI